MPLYAVHLRGISLLLGNDQAGSQVCVTPVVDSTPLEVREMEELEREHPEVFTACVVTRALARKARAQASKALIPQGEEEEEPID